MSRLAVLRAVESTGVVAVIRLKEPDKLRAVVDALLEGGVQALEVTMTVPGAVGLIESLARDLPGDFQLGAGTVLDAETARQVILAGARFVVAPVLDVPTIELCHRYDVAALPGCFTPTEILRAWGAGADIVKVFPATALGPGFFKDVRGPLPQVRMMPTGGVSLTNAGEWIKAGAFAVGVGTAMLDAKAIAARDFATITRNARTIVDGVRQARDEISVERGARSARSVER
jgi:2-dehydro-3-deoxyphosphogluconate aldolase / (4S)-4-hydroxy-2-oxoglutarate aldolase